MYNKNHKEILYQNKIEWNLNRINEDIKQLKGSKKLVPEDESILNCLRSIRDNYKEQISQKYYL